MKNHWTTHKIVAKGHPFWTFTVYEKGEQIVVPETVIAIDESPKLKVTECLEENGTWKPILIVWEKFVATYTDEKFIEGHNHIRLLEADGNMAGILRMYDKAGEHTESWVMHGLKLEDIEFPLNSLKATFTFHHAKYFNDES